MHEGREHFVVALPRVPRLLPWDTGVPIIRTRLAYLRRSEVNTRDGIKHYNAKMRMEGTVPNVLTTYNELTELSRTTFLSDGIAEYEPFNHLSTLVVLSLA